MSTTETSLPAYENLTASPPISTCPPSCRIHLRRNARSHDSNWLTTTTITVRSMVIRSWRPPHQTTQQSPQQQQQQRQHTAFDNSYENLDSFEKIMHYPVGERGIPQLSFPNSAAWTFYTCLLPWLFAPTCFPRISVHLSLLMVRTNIRRLDLLS